MEDFERIKIVEHLTKRSWNGKNHTIAHYRIARQVPLCNTDDALLVNFFECTIHCEETDKTLYRGGFATSMEVSLDTVEDYTAQARTRWKIENENNNTLKNQGYHLEHNFGHGIQWLSITLLTLNLLAFLFHSVLKLIDTNYQRVRASLGTRQTFFNDIKALTRYLYFDSFQSLLTFMAEGLELIPVQQIRPGSQSL